MLQFMLVNENEHNQHTEIINRKQLRARLGISEVTCIKLDKAGKLKSFRVGNSVRYNWTDIIADLQQKGFSGK
jgi:hypothetical protein